LSGLRDAADEPRLSVTCGKVQMINQVHYARPTVLIR
jgi:hypothetical protein